MVICLGSSADLHIQLIAFRSSTVQIGFYLSGILAHPGIDPDRGSLNGHYLWLHLERIQNMNLKPSTCSNGQTGSTPAADGRGANVSRKLATSCRILRESYEETAPMEFIALAAIVHQ